MTLSAEAQRLNSALEAAHPGLISLLSDLGRGSFFPKGIPAQAAEAKGKAYNGTIGQITDGKNHAIPLPILGGALEGLPAELRNKAFLYAPMPGLAEAREAWRAWQRRDVADAIPSSLPIATVGLTHALSIIADLFGGPGRLMSVPGPFWGNYRHIFGVRTGVTLLEGDFYRGGAYNPMGVEEGLREVPRGVPAIAVVNLPSNPGGYSPTVAERALLRESLIRVAEDRPLLVICDDAYAGLVFAEGVPTTSMFWELIGTHENLVPVKVDGITKELSFFGGRVGFLTFPFAPGSPAAQAIESKVTHMIRSGVGSTVTASQALVAYALSQGVEDQVEAVRRTLAERWAVLGEALRRADPQLIQAMPFNAGCFALMKLGPAVTASAEEARLHLLDTQDVGLISVGERYLRIAHCSVAKEDLPEMIRRVELGLKSLPTRR